MNLYWACRLIISAFLCQLIFTVAKAQVDLPLGYGEVFISVGYESTLIDIGSGVIISLKIHKGIDGIFRYSPADEVKENVPLQRLFKLLIKKLIKIFLQ